MKEEKEEIEQRYSGAVRQFSPREVAGNAAVVEIRLVQGRVALFEQAVSPPKRRVSEARCAEVHVAGCGRALAWSAREKGSDRRRVARDRL